MADALARRVALAAVLLTAACVARQHAPKSPAPVPVPPVLPSGAQPPVALPAREQGGTVRIALDTHAEHVVLSATSYWDLSGDGGAKLLLRSSDAWPISRDGSFLYAAGSGDQAGISHASAITARGATAASIMTVNGRPYRGTVTITSTSRGLLVVNQVPMEAYLRGVVPLEIGHRTSAERAAVLAQAVAARSYAYSHVDAAAQRSYDMVGTVMDQVYGGVKAETPLGDSAVAETAGLVLTYDGHVVSAPYHSTCGGSTAAPSEVWHGGAKVPYLVPVSDRIPGTDRYYCDISPSFRWTRTFSRDALATALQRYLDAYVHVPGGHVGTVKQVKVSARTKSGRVRSLVIRTTRGNYTLTEDQIRFVMRSPSGALLRSTAFTAESTHGSHGVLTQLVLHGRGNGHGVGMCQWGAIGRARAGQDFRTILATYYPGTRLEHVDE
ncbi:MAG TPA: SpoIID/LytB domain-containing protein [Gemmatimonadaceae bacterium]|nr:SpoIID/LytB domain-containing protein [Gemmatimonadaceae bacterium]